MVVVASKVAIKLNLGKRALDDIDVIHIVAKSIQACNQMNKVIMITLDSRRPRCF